MSTRRPPGLIALLAFLVAVSVLLLLMRSRTGFVPLAERVVADDVAAFEDGVRSELGVVELRPATHLRVRASRVRWADDAGGAWLQAPQLAFTIRAADAVDGAVVIQDGVMESPVVRLVERAPGRWNFAPVLGGLMNRPTAEPTLALTLRNVRIRNGDVMVVRAGETYRATGLQVVVASGVLAGPGVAAPSLHVTTARAVLALPDTPLGPVTRTVSLENARLRFPTGAVAFDVARATFGTSVARAIVGRWDPALGGLGVEATAVVERLALADIPWLRAEAPEDAVAAGTVRVESLPGDRSRVVLSGLSITSETSAAQGSVRLMIGPAGAVALEYVDLVLDPLAVSLIEAFTGPLPYGGELRGTVRGPAEALAIDLRAALATAPGQPPFRVDLTGTVAFTDVGLDLRALATELHAVPFAALAPLAPGLPFRGAITGVIRLDGPPTAAPISLDIRLELAGGVVAIAGTVDLGGPVPAYDLTGRIIGVELQQLLEPAAPPAEVHATFSLAGRGVTLPDAVATLRMDGRFTGWQTARGDTIAIGARLDRGLLVADEGRIALGPIDLVAEGEWRFAHGTGGAIRYALDVAALDPLAPYLPRPEGAPLVARGALAAEGTLAGTLDAPVLAGTVRAADFFWADWAAARLEAVYDVRLGPGIPHAVVTATGRDLRTPAGDFRTAMVDLELTPPVFDIHVVGERMGDRGRLELAAHGRLDEPFREVTVRTLELDLEQQRWRLPEPARIEWTPAGVVYVTDLRLEQVDGGGLVRVAGVLAPADLTDLRIDVAALPVGDLAAMIRPDLGLTGNLWLEGTVRGPAAAPLVDVQARLLNGMVRGVAVEELRGHLEYRDGVMGFLGEAILTEDLARLDVEARAPMELVLGFPPTVELIPDQPLYARIHSEAFDLAVLQPGIPDVRELAGQLSVDILVGGTAMDPVLSGTAAIREGVLTLRLLNQRYEAVEGEATLEGDVIRLDRLVARSDGSALATGTIRLDDLANPVLDLVVELDRFRAQRVSGRRDAAFSGRISLRGTPLVPVIAGNIFVDDGTLDLAQLQAAPPLSEDLIGLTERFDPLGPGDLDLLEPAPTRVRITRLDLTAGPAFWVQMDEFRAQVQGDITVRKPGEDVMISGVLTGERGTFNLRIGPLTRRFDILSVSIQFFGTPGPDPALDITAARIIPGPNRTDFELRVGITGTLSSPVLAFATADQTPIAEAEAINFLIFGRDIATLADFPGAGLGSPQTLYDALAFYGTFDWISAALAEQFGAGIDHFQLQVRSGTADLAPELVFVLGHEIIDDVFVLVTLPTTDFEARWALTAEWRIDRQWTLEAGYEPPDLVIGVPGRRLPVALEREQQLFVSIRRRWTY
jgi:hypothetical protein